RAASTSESARRASCPPLACGLHAVIGGRASSARIDAARFAHRADDGAPSADAYVAPARLREQLTCRGDHALRRDAFQAFVMALGTNAAIAVATRHVAIEHAALDAPWRMLRIRQCIKVDDRRADRR